MTMQITEHFTLEELIVSEVAARRGLSNTPRGPARDNLVRLCSEILEPLRAGILKPIVVTSGYRSPEVNAAVGGAQGSDHCAGMAADIIVPGMRPIDVCQRIVAMDLPYKQVIHEFGRWCHVSIGAAKAPKRETLTAKFYDDRVTYLKGLIA